MGGMMPLMSVKAIQRPTPTLPAVRSPKRAGRCTLTPVPAKAVDEGVVDAAPFDFEIRQQKLNKASV